MKKPPIISYEQIEHILDIFNPAVREHDGKTYAIEIANCQLGVAVKWYEAKIREIFEEIEKYHQSYRYALIAGSRKEDTYDLHIKCEAWEGYKDKFLTEDK